MMSTVYDLYGRETGKPAGCQKSSLLS